jgi:hypothetical protein
MLIRCSTCGYVNGDRAPSPPCGAIAHLDGWIVVSSGKQLTELLGTRRLARLEAKRLCNGIVGRCTVCPARQITVWKGEKRGKA